ncbi:unnamed protein product [Porites lobata]|uniref:Uncharacterized protein n=1 Tax=Porites lobata TaxID=104759 RepID=A0ABN8NFR8_9CNID|nr:unnamed protein product [Porites lobata]
MSSHSGCRSGSGHKKIFAKNSAKLQSRRKTRKRIFQLNDDDDDDDDDDELYSCKMEKQLRSLAAFLGECSRIVSQVLDSSDSSSNGNMTLARNSSDCFESFSPLNNQIAGEQPALFQVQSNELDLCFKAVDTDGYILAS